MADVVNLRRSRKAKARQTEAEEAQARRLAFGRPAAERRRKAALEELEAKRLAGHRLETEGKDER